MYADDEPPTDGKILFKKPAKRSSSDKFQGITASSSKKKKSEGGEKEERTEVKSGKKVKNNSLLSFGGDEAEDDDWEMTLKSQLLTPITDDSKWATVKFDYWLIDTRNSLFFFFLKNSSTVLTQIYYNLSFQ